MKYKRLTDGRVFKVDMIILVSDPKPESPFVIKEFIIMKDGNLYGIGYWTYKGKRVVGSSLFLAGKGQFIEFVETK